MLKNIIFDFDGVLVDSEILARKAFCRYLANKGIELTEMDFSKNYSGNKLVQVIPKIAERFNIKNQEFFFKEVVALTEKTYLEELTTVKGVREFLEKIKYKKFIASNRIKKSIIKGLEIVNLNNFFNPDDIFSFDMVANPKPCPDVFLKAVEIGKINKNETIIIEDSFIGVKAGVAANIRVIGVTSGGHWTNRSSENLIQAGAYAIAKGFDEVLYIISKL